MVVVQLNPGPLDSQEAKFTAFLQVARVAYLLQGQCRAN